MDFLSSLSNVFGGGLGYIIPFILVLTPVVFIHESGHFWMGRLFNTRIETFSIGFGRALLSWTDRHQTQWKIGWMPLGGYVKFWGDQDETSSPDEDHLAALRNHPDAARCFHFKPLWQKALIVLAGPLANFIFAIAVLAGLFMTFGISQIEPRIGAVLPGSPAERAGLQTNDIVVSVDGEEIHDFADIRKMVRTSAGDAVAVVYRRDGQDSLIELKPELTEVPDPIGRKQKEFLLGISPASDAVITFRRFGLFDAVGQATGHVAHVVQATLAFFKGLILGREDASKLSGPVGIAEVSGKVAKLSYVALIELAAMVSIGLGLMNLFPIPMLDGGHLMFYAVEAVRGRALGPKAQEVALLIGLALVASLMLFATWNDLMRIFWS